MADLLFVYNDIINFAGPWITDLNNEGIVDMADLLLAYNNLINLVGVVSP